ncbi:hypothetical protein [Helicobacter sp. 11S02596-1]|uniref:hypothetical protein n=1 Tax=Helicobacter sp. 11S02596-1 TaxID=1476194 RepID=UPI000BA56313|nr:hypothetical protein [Helicobacter sp. 11S02596-1]PAF42335.1 hypothetical protein BJI48_06875 [Helicobacter sp. 11S02596-1]
MTQEQIPQFQETEDIQKNSPSGAIDQIEIKISGRRFQITLEGFTQEAKNEVITTFGDKDLELTELLKTHLNKIQEYSLLNQKLESLLHKITS